MRYCKTIRQIDTMGRIVLPIEIRQTLGLNPGDKVNIELENENIIISGCKNCCVFCNSKYDLVKHNDKHICSECLKMMFAKFN